jgi:hypothetical protein
MRLRLITLLLLSMSTPLYAQTAKTTSGSISASNAISVVNVGDPPAAGGGGGGDPTNRVITPPTVVAPGLTAAGVETCLGSASGGISLMGGGFTFGSTKVDDGCTIRLLARQLFAFGFHNAALALMCQDQRVFVAMEETGTPCPAPPVDLGPGAPVSLDPPSADEDPPSPAAHEAQVKPFTKEEAALFARIPIEE